MNNSKTSPEELSEAATQSSLSMPPSQLSVNESTQLVGPVTSAALPLNETARPGVVPRESIAPTINPVTSPKIIFSVINAKMGEHYASEIQVHGETELKKVVITGVSFSRDVGLSIPGPDFNMICGHPLTDGDVELLIDYRFKDSLLDGPVLKSKCHLFINPDPRSLWKKFDPPLDDPYFKKNEDGVVLSAADNRVMVAASRRGRSHEHSGTFRDDDFCLHSENGWDIISIADGAGSAKSSRRGSEIAVHKSVDFLKDALLDKGHRIEQEAALWAGGNLDAQVKTALYDSIGRAAFFAVKAIESEAAANNANPKDYSTTLLIAIHKKISVGHFFAAYWVGDGGIGLYQKGKIPILLGQVDSGEYAGQTRFLDKQVMTGEEIMKRLRFTIVNDFTGLVLMTDGVTDPKFETDSNLSKQEKWDELWSELEPLIKDSLTAGDELLKWLEFWSPGNHDDRTIALLY